MMSSGKRCYLRGVKFVLRKHLSGIYKKKYLEETALYLYGLKVNATNKLYVSYSLDIYWRRNDLLLTGVGEYVVVPEDIYNECKKINDSYKKKHVL